MGRVSIGTCSGPAEAVLVRTAFSAHDIPVVINGENHASMLGGLAGAFIPLHIVVAEEDAETAAALLRDLREHDRGDEHEDAEDAEDEIAEDEPSGDPPVDAMLLRRRRTVVAVLLALCVTFGTGHMSARAWLRGMALAGLEIVALRYLFAGDRIGAFLLCAGIAFDLIGALWIVRHARPEIPRAVARQRLN